MNMNEKLWKEFLKTPQTKNVIRNDDHTKIP